MHYLLYIPNDITGLLLAPRLRLLSTRNLKKLVILSSTHNLELSKYVLQSAPVILKS